MTANYKIKTHLRKMWIMRVRDVLRNPWTRGK
jgi:hypothetical protein